MPGSGISADLARTTSNLRDRMSTGVLAPGGDLDRGLKGFADTATKLSALSDQLNRIVGRTGGDIETGSKSLLRSVENVEVVTTQVLDLVGKNRGAADSTVGTVTAALQKAQDTLANLDKLVGHVENIAADVDAGKGNVGRLLRDETLVRSAEQMIMSSSNLLKRYTELEIGVDYRLAAHAALANNPNPMKWQSHLSLRLQPSPEKYVLATLTRNNLPGTKTFSRVTASSGGADPPLLRETFEEIDHSPLLVGLQYARRFGPVTLRGGLIESSAGGGFDMAMLREKLMISADLFRFTGDTRPRLRASVLWTFVPHLYAWVGGDELLFPGSRADLFYGLGLAFTDNDLLVLFASAPRIQVGN